MDKALLGKESLSLPFQYMCGKYTKKKSWYLIVWPLISLPMALHGHGHVFNYNPR